MEKNKTEISYWLRAKGDEGDTSILSTETSKVPEVGEIINFDHHWDEERAHRSYSHLNENHKKTFFPKSEKLIEGDHVVVSVRRYIKNDYIKTKISKAFEGVSGFSNSTGGTFINDSEIPISHVRECFEVFIEPVLEVGLVETPIAKVRNLFGPIVTHFTMLKMMNEQKNYDSDVKIAMNKLFEDNIVICDDVMDKLTKIIKDDKNWK